MAEVKQVKTKGQAKIFNNKFLEIFTKTHPAVIICMYIPIILAIEYWDYAYNHHNILRTIGLFSAGILTWSLAEYLLHRFFFHIVSGKKGLSKLIYLAHGHHHEYPKDKQRLLMPPLPSLILASTFFGFWYLILWQYSFSFFPGFVAGYLIYGMIHYSIHAFPNPHKIFKPLWKHHNLHHFKYPDKGFGVSSSLWDRIFRTTYPTKKKKQST